jgi:hypothetical protein
MLRFILDILLLRQLIESPLIRRFVLIAFVLLLGIVVLFTAHVFLTLPERTSGRHVQHHSSR